MTAMSALSSGVVFSLLPRMQRLGLCVLLWHRRLRATGRRDRAHQEPLEQCMSHHWRGYHVPRGVHGRRVLQVWECAVTVLAGAMGPSWVLLLLAC